MLREHHLWPLQLACEAWERAQAAREVLDREGLTVPGREGGIRLHPCVAIERDARLALEPLTGHQHGTAGSQRIEITTVAIVPRLDSCSEPASTSHCL